MKDNHTLLSIHLSGNNLHLDIDQNIVELPIFLQSSFKKINLIKSRSCSELS